MKTFKSILIIVIVLPLAVAVLNFTKTDKDFSEQNSEIIPTPGIPTRQLCYIWNTEAGDSAKLSMNLKGDEVAGELYWLPAEKDSKVGVFKGSVSKMDPMTSSRTINAIWETKSEGMIVSEEIKIIFGEGTANVGFGEMKDRGDGVYVYVNPEKLSYEPNLQQTGCEDEAME